MKVLFSVTMRLSFGCISTLIPWAKIENEGETVVKEDEEGEEDHESD